MVDVERDLVFLVAPVVGQVVVHLHRIPDDVRQERDRDLMHRRHAVDVHHLRLRVEVPARGVHDLAGGAVHDFPVPVRVRVAVRPELLVEEAFHERHVHVGRLGQHAGGEQVDLRGLVHMLGDPFVVRARREIRGVHLLAEGDHLLVEVGAVGVADRVRAPELGELAGLAGEVFLRRNRETTGCGHRVFSLVDAGLWPAGGRIVSWGGRAPVDMGRPGVAGLRMRGSPAPGLGMGSGSGRLSP